MRNRRDYGNDSNGEDGLTMKAAKDAFAVVARVKESEKERNGPVV